MINFLKNKFGYGLAGFLVGIFIIAFGAAATNTQISGKYLWAGPVGFILGLLLPKEVIGKLFLSLIRSQSKVVRSDGQYLDKDLDLEEKQKGWLVKVVYAFGILFFLFLIYIVFRGLIEDIL